ncbi:MAG: hypothetical protein R3222_03750 [Balneolaceae bacterium]|nr:hypothetical protein [Balneolaceae bacterium]
MYRKSSITILTFVIAIFFGITACGDNSTSVTEEEPPALPNLEYSQPDVSYFENTTVKLKSASQNFLTAKSTVLSFSSLSSIGMLYGNILQSAPQGEGSLNDGTWEWTYSYNYQGASSEMRVTAQESGNSISWAVYWSYSDSEVTIEDYKLMEGTTQNDGLTGNWTFNSFGAESSTPIPLLTSSWVTDGEGESEIDIEILDDSSGDVAISYDKAGSEFLMQVTFETGGDNTEIGWNTETNLGYIQLGSDAPLCWDSSNNTVVDISCPGT